MDGQIRFDYGYEWTWKFLNAKTEEVSDSKISGYLWTGPKYPLQFQLEGTLGPHWLIPRKNPNRYFGPSAFFLCLTAELRASPKKVKERLIAARICYGQC